jgi:hypothetical protein
MMVRSSARVDLGIQHVGIVLCIRWRSGPSVGRDRTGPECRRKVVPVLDDRQRLDGALHERRGDWCHEMRTFPCCRQRAGCPVCRDYPRYPTRPRTWSGYPNDTVIGIRRRKPVANVALGCGSKSKRREAPPLWGTVGLRSRRRRGRGALQHSSGL